MTQPKSVAIAVTDYSGPFYLDGFNTGAYFSEVFHPWKAFTAAGFEVQLISEDGKFGWDQHSISEGAAAPQELAVLRDKSHPFNKFTSEIKSVTDVDSKDFGIAFAAGGHGTIYDFDGNTPNLYKFFANVYSDGGLATAVCHGPVLLGFVKDINGKHIASGKKVTGFPNVGEKIFKLEEALNYHKKRLTHDIVVGSGAIWVEPKEPLGPTVVIDGRIITGSNPASATPVAEAAVKAINSL